MALSSLSIYRQLLDDPVIKKFYDLISYLCTGTDPVIFLNLYNELFFTLASSNTSLASYIMDLIIFDDNPFSHCCTKGENCELLEDAARRDLKCLQFALEITPTVIKTQAKILCNLETKELAGLPEWEDWSNSQCSSGLQTKIKETLYSSGSWGECLPALKKFYPEVGAGIFACYYAFTWERAANSGFFKGIASPDPVRLKDLFGYEEERSEILENTQQFLKGYPANNVLLYGDRGTGKSSTVKAIVNEYHPRGLRIIEVPKNYLGDFPEITRELRERSQRFIIFVDDLTFEDSTENYTALKAVLEGGLESRPANVLIYATSNRRHLVKESFSDRAFSLDEDTGEIHESDSIQEKLSLADRFGITVIFTAPDQEQYLEIIEAIAKQRNIQIAREKLHREALRWATRHNGRSPRTARQFIDWLEGAVCCTPHG